MNVDGKAYLNDKIRFFIRERLSNGGIFEKNATR